MMHRFPDGYAQHPPARISLGKWTNRYRREKAIIAANGMATQPNLRLVLVSTVAPIAEASVWPEGNE